MVIANDPIGQKFGRLTVLKYDHSNKHNVRYYICCCECGNEKIIQRSALMSGATLSCGCLSKELSRLRKSHFKHGFSNKERLYETWKNMKRRCYNSKNNRYSSYGGKGITVCDEWLNNYMNFRNWALSSGYTDKLTIDRINNDKGYFPSNCRWATSKEQENNMSRNRIINYLGENHTMSEWSEILEINYNLIGYRIRKGLTMEQIMCDLSKLTTVF